MDLFAAAGIDAPSGRSGRPARPAQVRSLRVPLFNYRVVDAARQRALFQPTEAELAAAAGYAKRAGSAAFAKQKETAVRPIFFSQVLGGVLGYREFDEAGYTLSHEHSARRGPADLALGRFGGPDDVNEIVAPLEAKGPGTRDLDAIPAGERRSPVQQAWDYAVTRPGSRFVLVTNCLELRLYGFGKGLDAYESFDLAKLDDRDEHERLWLMLSADRLLGGDTDAMLRETEGAFREITSDLYRDYKSLREKLIQFLVDSPDGPRLAAPAAIEQAQKLLDRILFVAFGQRTDLLPDNLLKRVEAAGNDFDPQPLWTNFRGLFRSLDRGNFNQTIEAYNGGLFASDPVADALNVPDHLLKELVKLGDWDYRRDVPVTVLGHLFEQSVTDLETLRARWQGQPEPDEKSGKRKRHGIVYTPDVITRFLVDQTIGLVLREHVEALVPDGRSDEPAPWRAYLGALRGLRIVDPACGSGAFLVAAFDVLAREYRRVVEKLHDLGEEIGFDVVNEIVTKNLYGVDLNAESVEITRLSLWLKTARRKHKLQNLEATIKVGNSLIEDGRYTDRPFDWRQAFPNVFADGGFDIVIGNPPYVRMEVLKPVKPYLEQHYAVAAERADLYAYFFERGVEILKDGGRLGFISSSTFFRTGSGENLRTFLGDRVAIDSVVDFGDLQVFEGVTTYPAILTLRKTSSPAGELRFLKSDDALPKDLSAAFAERARPMPRTRLGAGSWRFEDEALARLRDKIASGRRTLGEVYGPPLRGIVTGLNEAFVIDTATRDRLVATDPRSAELLVPFLRGEDVKRWRVEPEGVFLINTPKGQVDIEAHPAIRDWLLPLRPELERRATRQAWWELQQAQLAYQPQMASPKIAYQDIANQNPFALDVTGAYLANTVYFLPESDTALLAYLNSRLAWFCFISLTNIARGGYLRLRSEFVERLPVLDAGKAFRRKLHNLGERTSLAAGSRFKARSAVERRLYDLVSSGSSAKLTRRLERWWELSFAEFRGEVTRAFGRDIPLRQRAEWEGFLAENAAEVRRLTAEIEAAEREIDALVYRAFDLTPAEIKLLEDSLTRRD